MWCYTIVLEDHGLRKLPTGKFLGEWKQKGDGEEYYEKKNEDDWSDAQGDRLTLTTCYA